MGSVVLTGVESILSPIDRERRLFFFSGFPTLTPVFMTVTFVSFMKKADQGLSQSGTSFVSGSS